MSIITINTDKWITQQEKAKTYPKADGKGIGVSVQYICGLIKKNKLKSKRIEELGIVLVEK